MRCDQHCCWTCDHTHTITWYRGLIYWILHQENRNKRKKLWSHYFISNQTSLPQQKWKILLFDRKIFRKTSPKYRIRFDKPSPKNRNPQQQKISRNATKKQPNCAGKPPKWQHCLAVSKTLWFGSTGFFFSFLFIQLRVYLNNMQSCLSRQVKIVRPCQEIYPLPVLPF